MVLRGTTKLCLEACPDIENMRSGPAFEPQDSYGPLTQEPLRSRRGQYSSVYGCIECGAIWRTGDVKQVELELDAREVSYFPGGRGRSRVGIGELSLGWRIVFGSANHLQLDTIMIN